MGESWLRGFLLHWFFLEGESRKCGWSSRSGLELAVGW